MINKKIRSIICAMLITTSLAFLTGCNTASESNASVTMENKNLNVDVEKLLSSIQVKDDDSNYDEKAKIVLQKDSISVDGSGASVDGSKVTITEAGLYKISGELSDGQIIINAGKDDKVKLELDNVSIKCSNNSAIYVMNADKTVLNLKEGTINTVEDGASYNISEDENQDSAIYSKDDLIIDGSGTLNINGNYKNALVSKNDLTIVDSKLNIVSKNDGIKGKDSVRVKNANITIKADGDGIQSNNDTDAEKGYVLIESGSFNITSGLDGIQAETVLAVRDGDINIISGGGSENATKKAEGFGNMPQGGERKPKNEGMFPNNEKPSDEEMFKNNPKPDDREMFENNVKPDDERMLNNKEDVSTEEQEESKKGLKSANNITIEKGNIKVDSADDAIHSNSSVNINNGTININAGDDGIHADSDINITGGKINIEKSYEGIEATNINISDGEIKLVSSDDGINGTGEVEQSNSDNSDFRKGGMDASTNAMVSISGGYIYMDASGDGLDSNGNVDMTGGTVIINGTTNDGNGALDYNGVFNITGGTLVAAGSSGMAQAPSESSTQNSVGIGFSETQEANSTVSIQDADGNEILTFSPAKSYNHIVISSSKIEKDKEYKVLIGGTSNGTQKDGLYLDGKYSEGTEFKTFSVSKSVTSVGESPRMGGKGGANNEKNRKNISRDDYDNDNGIVTGIMWATREVG